MVVAIIDTGVDSKHEALKDCRVRGGITIFQTSMLRFDYITGSYNDRTGHGTSIAGIIRDHVKDVELFIIKLESFNGIFSEELLCRAIAVALDIATIRVINVSLGIVTESPSARLYQLCLNANKRRICIVASAYSDAGRPCYPAHFDFVYGVGSGYFTRDHSYQYLPDNRTNILAHGGRQRIAHLANTYIDTGGTSYATAHFTGILYNMLLTHITITFETINDLLKTYSTNPIIDIPTNYTPVEKILSVSSKNQGQPIFASIRQNRKTLSLFPFNSADLISLREHPENYGVDKILGINLPPGNFRDEKEIRFENSTKIELIDHIPTKEDLRGVEVVAIGNITDTFGLDSYKYGVLKRILELDKVIITWQFPLVQLLNDIITVEGFDFRGQIICPKYDEDFFETSELNQPIPACENIPQIAILNFSTTDDRSRSIKLIAAEITRRQYIVSNFLVDSDGILFDNADVVFPFKAKNMVRLQCDKWGIFIRQAKRLIAVRSNPDIFIAGTFDIQHPKFVDYAEDFDDSTSLKNLVSLRGLKADHYIAKIDATRTTHDIRAICKYVCDILGIKPLAFLSDQLNSESIMVSGKKVPIVKSDNVSLIVDLIEKKYSK